MFDFFKRKKNKQDSENFEIDTQMDDTTIEEVYDSENNYLTNYEDKSSTSDYIEGTENIDIETNLETSDRNNEEKTDDKGFFSKLKEGLAKTRNQFTSNLKNLLLEM